MSDAERVRLFVALELPAQAREPLVAWRSEAVRGLDGLRLIAADDLHVTLCFLGWRANSETGAIAAACAQAAARWPGGELELGPAIWLPSRRPRVLAVELIDRQGGIGSLQGALAAGLEAGGWYRPEQRPFRTHVSVARVRRAARIPRREPVPPPSLGFPAGPVTLFRSRLSPSGARYEALGRFGS